MSKIQFTGTATQPQRNRNATENVVNLIRTSTVMVVFLPKNTTVTVAVQQKTRFPDANETR